MAIGSHQSAAMRTDEWLTPPEIINELGPFDLDPCAPSEHKRPWDTARHHYSLPELCNADGLTLPWFGRVWLNPPYGRETGIWLQRMADHGDGIALIFARTETDMFFRYVWDKADGLLFIRNRIHFYHINGTRAKHNSGAPSVLVAYGLHNSAKLAMAKIEGKIVGKYINLQQVQ
jgi:hypothetical protein